MHQRQSRCKRGHNDWTVNSSGRHECHTCRLVSQRRYYTRNKEKEYARSRKWQQANPEKVQEYAKVNYQRHKEAFIRRARVSSLKDPERTRQCARRYRERNREKMRAASLKWARANMQKIIAYGRERRRGSVQVRLACNLRTALSKALQRNFKKRASNLCKQGSAIRDLGCSVDSLKIYLDEQFTSSMTWGNWGQWHIDHIVPLSRVDLMDRCQLLKVVHYTNLQPLWAAENIRKGNRIISKSEIRTTLP